MNLQILYKIKKKEGKEGEEMHKEDVCLKENCIKRQEWTFSLYYCHMNFHEQKLNLAKCKLKIKFLFDPAAHFVLILIISSRFHTDHFTRFFCPSPLALLGIQYNCKIPVM